MCVLLLLYSPVNYITCVCVHVTCFCARMVVSMCGFTLCLSICAIYMIILYHSSIVSVQLSIYYRFCYVFVVCVLIVFVVSLLLCVCLFVRYSPSSCVNAVHTIVCVCVPTYSPPPHPIPGRER